MADDSVKVTDKKNAVWWKDMEKPKRPAVPPLAGMPLIAASATPDTTRVDKEDAPLPAEPRVRYLDRSYMTRFSRDVLVPVGMLCTSMCLILGIYELKLGNSRNQQLFMRGRVGFQGLTFVTMGVGMYFTLTDSKRNQAKPSVS